jgi:peptidoglycan/xylan/chitin deacetylase (PgdA/CDA1 family)
MMPLTRPRRVALVALVVVATLGGVYLLGRSLGSPDPRPVGRQAAPAFDLGSEPAPSRPAPSPSLSPTATPPVSPTTDSTRPPGVRPALLPDGPLGTWETTGADTVALTFDDGPDPRYTPQILAMLRAYDVPAIFCVVGANAQRYPELIRAIAAEGHTLCNHSWEHDFALGSRSVAGIRTDLLRTNQAIRAAVPDVAIPYYRQPGGYWTPALVSVAGQLGMTSLHWTVDPSDWRRPPAARITRVVSEYSFPGAIVLLHDAGGNRQYTVDSLPALLPDLKRRFNLSALPDGIRPTVLTAAPDAAAPTPPS